MNLNTANALEEFIRLIPISVCRCTMQEQGSGHLSDCRYNELEEKASALIHALNTDETLIT